MKIWQFITPVYQVMQKWYKTAPITDNMKEIANIEPPPRYLYAKLWI